MSSPIDKNNQINITSNNITQNETPVARTGFRSQVMGILNRIGRAFGRGDTAARAGTAATAALRQAQGASTFSNVTTIMDQGSVTRTFSGVTTLVEEARGQKLTQAFTTAVTEESAPTPIPEEKTNLKGLSNELATSNKGEDFKDAYIKLGKTLGGLPPLTSETPTTGSLRTKLGALKKENPELYQQVVETAGQMRGLGTVSGLDDKEKGQIEKIAQAIVQFNQPTH